MRVWLQKQKKKEEAKSASQVVTPPVAPTPAATEAQQAAELADKPIESVEIVPKEEHIEGQQPSAASDKDIETGQAPASAIFPSLEVSLTVVYLSLVELLTVVEFHSCSER